MAYIRGEEKLPPELLREIQKYIQGSLVYIPRPENERLGWGRKNGTRSMLDQRDNTIRCAKANGQSIEQLADEHGLSSDAIRKILYKRMPEKIGA
ncbi:MAG TPA: CD3324 family protein [Spirochaetales bacterium]|nr:CD3324 family protein [Spirochaetales bacterium]